MRVNKAAQVLSHTVAAGVYTYAALGKLAGEAVYTAEFIENIDSLFDSFNSRFFRDPKKLKRPLSKNSEHIKIFTETCMPILNNLKVIGAKNILFIKGWRLAISCLSQLWDDLRTNEDIEFLFTSRLNQDIVENLFATIRRKGGCRDNPSAREFRCAFRMVMVAELIKPNVGANCSPDSDKFVLTLQTLTTEKRKTSLPNKPATQPQKSSARMFTHVPFNVPEENTLAYIAGYLCRRCLAGHEFSSKCQVCREALLSLTEEVDDESLLFIHHKGYNTLKSDFGSLMVPSDHFLSFCKRCEEVFREEFSIANMSRNNIAFLINGAISNLVEYRKLKLCRDQVKSKIVGTFVSLRIHYALKFRNRNLMDLSKQRKNRKAQKVMHK